MLISSTSFFPSPKTDSGIVKLVKKKERKKVADEKLFTQFIHEIFRYKNKNLSNALINAWSFFEKNMKIKKEEFKEKINSLELKDSKVNLIEVQEFVELFNKLFLK